MQLPKDWRKTIERALDEAAPVVEDGVASSQEGRVYSVPTIVVRCLKVSITSRVLI